MWSSATGKTRIITTLAGTKADIVPELQAAYPPTWPTSLKQKDEFFGGWGGLNPYGGNYTGTLLDVEHRPVRQPRRSLHRAGQPLQSARAITCSRPAVSCGINEKVESSGNGADRPGLPDGNSTTAPGSLGSVDATAQYQQCAGQHPVARHRQRIRRYSPALRENSIDGIADVHWHDIEPYVGDTWKIRRNLTVDLGFRWSILREPYGGTNGGNTNPAYELGRQLPQPMGQLEPSRTGARQKRREPVGCLQRHSDRAWHNSLRESEGVPGYAWSQPAALQRHARSERALVQQNNHSIAPRVGIAWDVGGDGKTAVRIGGGQFFHERKVGLAENLATNAPFVIEHQHQPLPGCGSALSANFGFAERQQDHGRLYSELLAMEHLNRTGSGSQYHVCRSDTWAIRACISRRCTTRNPFPASNWSDMPHLLSGSA